MAGFAVHTGHCFAIELGLFWWKLPCHVECQSSADEALDVDWIFVGSGDVFGFLFNHVNKAIEFKSDFIAFSDAKSRVIKSNVVTEVA